MTKKYIVAGSMLNMNAQFHWLSEYAPRFETGVCVTKIHVILSTVICVQKARFCDSDHHSNFFLILRIGFGPIAGVKWSNDTLGRTGNDLIVRF